jgi:type II secretory pathway pseudopilin PulG
MSQIGKNNIYNIKAKKAFSLVEIIISLALFSFIITMVVGISLTLVKAQTRVQADVFLTQSAQTTLENITRNLRFGYNYSGTVAGGYNGSNLFIGLGKVDLPTQEIVGIDQNGQNIYATSTTRVSAVATSSLILSDAPNSPFVIFEAQDGNPENYTDQNAYCFAKDSNGLNKLYKIIKFQTTTTGEGFFAECSSGDQMLPEKIVLDYITFDVYGQSSTAPKNPMVRVKLKMSHIDGGSIEIQTSVTQRLIPYF